FRLGRRGRWPALHNLEGEKAEKGESGEFQIEPQVAGNLLDRTNTVELRSKLRLGDGEFYILDALESFFGVSRDARRIEFGLRAEVLELDETQARKRPVINIRLGGQLAGVGREFPVPFEKKAHAAR